MKARLSSTIWLLVFWTGLSLLGVLGLAYYAGSHADGHDATSFPGGASGALVCAAVLGMIALHTVDHPEVGPRWLATCATVDAVDLVATVAARKDLPTAGVLGTAAVAGGAAAAGFYLARSLGQS